MATKQRRARTSPISQVELEDEMLRLLEMLEEETENFEAISKDHAEKDALHKKKWADAYLKQHEGSIEHRKAWASYTTEKEELDAKIADALVRAKREKLLSLRTSLDVLRSLNSNVRAQVS